MRTAQETIVILKQARLFAREAWETTIEYVKNGRLETYQAAVAFKSQSEQAFAEVQTFLEREHETDWYVYSPSFNMWLCGDEGEAHTWSTDYYEAACFVSYDVAKAHAIKEQPENADALLVFCLN